MEAEARRELGRLVAEGLDPYRESLWVATLAYLTDAASALGDEATAALVYPELEPYSGENVMVGHLVVLLRRRRPVPGHARGEPGRVGARGSEHFENALELNRRMGADTWVAHTAYEYGRLLLSRPGGDRPVRMRCWARPRAGGSHRDAGVAGADSGDRVLRLGDRRPFRTACRRARSRSWCWWPRACRTARSARSSRSASTRPPTTCAASCARRAARTAPRPRPTHTGTALGAAGLTALRSAAMPVYMIERTFADQLDLTSEDVELIDEINADEGVRWLFSFLSADRRRTYCLYEAPSAEAIVEAARRANVPADVVVEVGAAAPELRAACRTGRTPSRRAEHGRIDFGAFDVLTFDCYGTLIDWETGLLAALRPVARGARRERGRRRAARDLRPPRGRARGRRVPPLPRAARAGRSSGWAPTSASSPPPPRWRRSAPRWATGPRSPTRPEALDAAARALQARADHQLRRRPVRALGPAAGRGLRLGDHRPAGRAATSRARATSSSRSGRSTPRASASCTWRRASSTTT